jgi:tetratricopeptide (TPR) repeat protein
VGAGPVTLNPVASCLLPGQAQNWREDTHTRCDPCSAAVRGSPSKYEDEIDALLDAEAWTSARWLLARRVRQTPHEHRCFTRLALTWLGEGRVEEARADIDRAARLAPLCPEVLFIRGAVLEACGEQDSAVAVLRALTCGGAAALTTGDCGLQLERAREILADGLLRLGRLYQARGERALQAACAAQRLALPNITRPGASAGLVTPSAALLWAQLHGPAHPSEHARLH